MYLLFDESRFKRPIHNTWTSLVPRPHPRGGKRVWWLWTKSLDQLMTRGGICASQSDHRISPVIWFANRRNVTGPLLTIQIWIAYTALLTNQIRALFKHTRVGACAQSRPNQEIGLKLPDPFPSFWGWGLGTRLHMNTQGQSNSCHMILITIDNDNYNVNHIQVFTLWLHTSISV
jgi:hypothetical protein